LYTFPTVSTGVSIDHTKKKLDYLMKTDKLFSNAELTLQQTAEKLNLTAPQLSEFINLHEGCNFISFINRYRISYAKELLLKTDEQVIQIAFVCGFNSKSAFNNTFKKETGITPTSFRRNHRKTTVPAQDTGTVVP
jgi:AraC-like DNA-binding protein